MEYEKLKKEVEATVKRLADDYFENMQSHPQDYAEWLNTSDEDECWESAIEKGKDDMRQEPMKWMDEDAQEEMEAQDWFFVREIVDGISWLTYNNIETERCFA